MSLALHSLLFLVRVQGHLPPRSTLHQDTVVLIPLAGPERVVPLRFPVDQPVPSRPAAPRRPPSLVPVLPERSPTVRQTERTLISAVPLPLQDTLVAPSPQVVGGGLRPARGEGNLWIAPLPLAPQELARRLTRSHTELVDSAVTEIIQAYIDSVMATPTESARLPAWTTRIAGAKVGIDQQFIYLGPIKIPSMLLALLKIPATQIDLNKARQVRAMQADLAQAARRTQTMADFRKAVRELRKERERQREFEKNRRRNPNDTTSVRP